MFNEQSNADHYSPFFPRDITKLFRSFRRNLVNANNDQSDTYVPEIFSWCIEPIREACTGMSDRSCDWL